jgi:hypothetical protein
MSSDGARSAANFPDPARLERAASHPHRAAGRMHVYREDAPLVDIDFTLKLINLAPEAGPRTNELACFDEIPVSVSEIEDASRLVWLIQVSPGSPELLQDVPTDSLATVLT